MKKSHREEYKQVLQQGNTLFTCYVCDRTFMSSEELTQHQPTHSKDDKPFKCVHCKESFKTFSELTVHRRQQCLLRQFTCKDCNGNFRSASMLRTHRMALHVRTDEIEQHEEAAKSPMCKKCGQSFESETDLVAHTEKHSKGQPCNGAASNKKRGRPAKVEDAAAADKMGKRKKKDEGEESEQEKGKSVVAKRGRPSKGAAKTDAEDKSSADEDQANEKKPKSEPLQIPCTECDLTFPGLVQLRAHKKEKHTQKKAHPCEECEESFARPEQLDAHMTRVHAVGRFACSTCGKSFGRERSLKAHEKTHNEEENQAEKR